VALNIIRSAVTRATSQRLKVVDEVVYTLLGEKEVPPPDREAIRKNLDLYSISQLSSKKGATFIKTANGLTLQQAIDDLGSGGTVTDLNAGVTVTSPSGGIVLNGGGSIRGGQTGYDTGAAGFFLGYSGGAYRLSIGDPAGHKFTFDGVSINVTGNVTSSSGVIGGWSISAAGISKGNVSLDSINERIQVGPDASNYVRISAAGLIGVSSTLGTLFNLPTNGTAPSFAGTLTSTAGSIGGWTITANGISKGNVNIDSANTRIQVGPDASNYVRISGAGIVGVDAVLGTTLSLPTNGDAPVFASGIIREVTFEMYTSGVLKTSDDPATDGGVLINNTGIRVYSPDGFPWFVATEDGLDLYNGRNINEGVLSVIDGGFESGQDLWIDRARSSSASSGFCALNVINARTGVGYFETPSATSNTAFYSKPAPVQPGDRTFYRVYLRQNSTTAPTSSASIRARWYDKDFGVLATTVLETVAPGGSEASGYVEHSGYTAVAPANSRYFSLRIGVDSTGTAAGSWWWDDLMLASETTQRMLEQGVTITGGGITLSAGGSIKGGQTAYATGTGFFLGYSGGAYKLSIGDSSSNYITWDGFSLTVSGHVKAGSFQAPMQYTRGTHLTAAYTSGGGTLSLRDTADFPSSGSAITLGSPSSGEQDTFSYTGKTATTLTGVSGLANTPTGTVCVPLNGPSFVLHPTTNRTYLVGDPGGGYRLVGMLDPDAGGAGSIASFGTDLDTTFTGVGVTGASYSGNGTVGYAVTGAGVFGQATGNGYGGRFQCPDTGKGPIQLFASSSAAAPSHSAGQGTLWVTSDGIPYVNTSGSTTWEQMVPKSAADSTTGAQDVSGSGTYVFPRGNWSYYRNASQAILYFNVNGTWRRVEDTGGQAQETVNFWSDGVNARVLNESGSTQTFHYRHWS